MQFHRVETSLENSLPPLTDLVPEMDGYVAYPLRRTFNTMLSLKIYLTPKLQKLQSRHFHTSRTQWEHVCETSFISFYHQDM